VLHRPVLGTEWASVVAFIPAGTVYAVHRLKTKEDVIRKQAASLRQARRPVVM